MKIRAAILVMKDWRERAFLRAQLIEEGIRTFAVRTVDEAEEWISDERVTPVILIYDDRFQESHFEDLKRLGERISSFPILILTGAGGEKAENLKNSGFVHVVRRPVSIGNVVEKVKEISKLKI